MISLSDLPTINASLNLTSTVLLVIGYLFVRKQRIRAHAACMIGAFVVSTLFLVSYIVYHYQAGHTTYEGQGVIRMLYLTVLLTHVLLAGTVPPLALRTFYLAWRRRWTSHKRWARWTLPIWLYVSVTGVVVYVMLYLLRP